MTNYDETLCKFLNAKVKEQGIVKWKRRILNRGDFDGISRGGIFNGDILEIDDHIVMISRCERYNWNELFNGFSEKEKWWEEISALPIISIWDKNITVCQEYFPLKRQNYPHSSRIEDFRLFTWGREIFCNHVYIFSGSGGRPQIASAVSKVDLNRRTLTFIDIPRLDFRINSTEKNWVFFEHKCDLFLVYSINPWRVLKLAKDFSASQTVLNVKFTLPAFPSDSFISCGANPLEFDDKHYILYYHTKFTEPLVYVQGAVLFDKLSLLPVSYSWFPYTIGEYTGEEYSGVLYISGAVDRGEKQLLIYGEADLHTGILEIDKKRLKGQTQQAKIRLN